MNHPLLFKLRKPNVLILWSVIIKHCVKPLKKISIFLLFPSYDHQHLSIYLHTDSKEWGSVGEFKEWHKKKKCLIVSLETVFFSFYLPWDKAREGDRLLLANWIGELHSFRLHSTLWNQAQQFISDKSIYDW